MNAIPTDSETFESTYALIVRSEEKQRTRFEIFIYALLIISTVLALSQAGRQAALMPPNIQRISTISTAVLPQSA
jgi:disulfide bond formation protein DsbB